MLALTPLAEQYRLIISVLGLDILRNFHLDVCGRKCLSSYQLHFWDGIFFSKMLKEVNLNLA